MMDKCSARRKTEAGMVPCQNDAAETIRYKGKDRLYCAEHATQAKAINDRIARERFAAAMEDADPIGRIFDESGW